MKIVKRVIIGFIALFLVLMVKGVMETDKELKNYESIVQWFNDNKSIVEKSFYVMYKENIKNGTVQVTQIDFINKSDVGSYYNVYFSGQLNNRSIVGYAWGFLKYQDNNVDWFALDVDDKENLSQIVQWDKEEYYEVVKKYYNEIWNIALGK